MMMRRSLMVASPEDGEGTFGSWLQKLSQVVSEMDERTRHVCMDVLRGYISTNEVRQHPDWKSLYGRKGKRVGGPSDCISR